MHVVILGAGALGTLLGAKVWTGGGVRVTLVARDAHARRVAASGVRLIGPSGAETVVGGDGLAAVSDPAEIDGDIDYLVVTVKATTGAEAVPTLRLLADRIGCALSFQNGIRQDEPLLAVLGAERVIAGVTMEGAAMPEPGTIRHILASTTFIGERDGTRSTRIGELVELLRRGSLEAAATSDIAAARWTKFVQSCAASGVCGVTRLGYAPATATPAGAALYVHLVKEGASVMRAAGYEPGRFLGDEALVPMVADAATIAAVAMVREKADHLIAGGYLQGTSLLRDLERGVPTEADALLGDMVRTAQRMNVATPMMAAVHLALMAADQSR